MRCRSHSADRLLEDDINLKIELTPLVTQVTGWEEQNGQPSNQSNKKMHRFSSYHDYSS